MQPERSAEGLAGWGGGRGPGAPAPRPSPRQYALAGLPPREPPAHPGRPPRAPLPGAEGERAPVCESDGQTPLRLFIALSLLSQEL